MTADARNRVAVRTLGCKVNRVESDDITAELLGRGAVLAEPDDASVIVINTCTVTGEADAKARKAVRQALASPSSPTVVVTGCLAALDAAALEALGARVVVEANKSRVADRVGSLLGLSGGFDNTPVRIGKGFRTRVPLKIQDGCDHRCTYCIVPDARGNPRSTPFNRVMGTAEAHVARGAREFVLTGINIGRYRDGDSDLAALVAALSHTGVWRIRLSSIEPAHLDESLVATLVVAGVRHLHVPLQSGSDAILAAMGRGYTADEYLARIDAARFRAPIAISTDVIVGFPGETEDDAAATIAVCERARFTKVHVFRYSPRHGTPAAGLPNQVPPRTKAARAASLRERTEAIRAELRSQALGRVEELLVESVDTTGAARATTWDYHKVSFEAAGAAAGDLVPVLLHDDRGIDIAGTRV